MLIGAIEMLTNEQVEMALVRSGFFYIEDQKLLFGYDYTVDVGKYLDDLTLEINKVIEETP